MNAIFFAAKRVFHGALRITRKPLQSVAPGLTAARFDVMYALAGASGGSQWFSRRDSFQCDLWRILGVSPQVVSRMLRSLEALGWITRYRPDRDKRQRIVTLTDAGLAIIRKAYGLLFHISARVVYHAICWGKHHDINERFKNMSTLEDYLVSLRQYCRDTARLYYAWGHPDD